MSYRYDGVVWPIVLMLVQVVKVSPYALPAAHKDLLELSQSLNRRAQNHNVNSTGTW